MDDLRTVSEITGDMPGEETCSLQIWYNKLLGKRKTEINIADVLRMFRQKVCLDIAGEIAVRFLEDDPFIGELWDCQLLGQIAGTELREWSKEQLYVIRAAAMTVTENADSYEWALDEERFEAEKAAALILERLREYID
ncbi:MAG: hypothetical protein K2N72_01355 [Oscillospiraceae bacterium]|nr:hypothetical protein [Oscillospiraceae bacterium]